MKDKKNHFAAKNILLIKILALSCLLLTGCQVEQGTKCGRENGTGNQSAAIKNEPVKYIPEFQILPNDKELHQVSFEGDDIYFLMYSNKFQPNTFRAEIYRGCTGSSELEKIEISLPDREVIQAIGTVPNGTIANTVNTNSDDMIYLATGNAESRNNNAEKTYNHIIRVNSAGIIQEILDISRHFQTENPVVDRLEVDAEGNIYLLSPFSQQIIVLNPAGELLFDYKSDGAVMDLCAADGKIYAAFYFGGAITVAEYQPVAKTFRTVYENAQAGFDFSMMAGKEDELLFNMSGMAYVFNITAGEAVPLLKWLDCKVAVDAVFGMKSLADGRFLVIDVDGAQAEYVYLREAMPGENPDAGKKTLTVYYEYPSAGDLVAAVNRFNKTNPDYLFEIVSYTELGVEEEITRLNTELVSGEGPDLMIFCLMSNYNVDYAKKKKADVFPLENYVKMGVFANLYDYMDADPDFHREDYFENILKTFEMEGQLCYFPVDYTPDTVLAKPSDVGKEMGWTLEEMMDRVAEKEYRLSITGLLDDSTEKNVLSLCLRMGIKEITEGKEFDRELMLKILSFAHQVAEAERAAGSNFSQDGLQLMVYENGDGIGNYINFYNTFGEYPTYIGYPAESGSGTLVSTPALAAINRNSIAKEAAWELIKILTSRNGILIASYLRKDAYKAEEEFIAGAFTEEEIPSAEMAEFMRKQRERIESINTARIHTQVEMIVMEEAEYYFRGEKPIEEVVNIIANRVSLYLNENQ